MSSFGDFFFNDTATTEIYTLSYTLSLHDALPISCTIATIDWHPRTRPAAPCIRSEEHTSELQSHSEISYAVFCLKKKNKKVSRHNCRCGGRQRRAGCRTRSSRRCFGFFF